MESKRQNQREIRASKKILNAIQRMDRVFNPFLPKNGSIEMDSTQRVRFYPQMKHPFQSARSVKSVLP
jgi:hypothetical protein